ncbi:MAG TPA: fibronectin-binding domain-containing protein [Pyrodictium delaneyi]|uniref:Fibronectin-binding domain-containing protein n=1 Tax=Pyrodictium delaneyi TaxID=1273541 RepID=A0A832ZT70_9CREN|nr:fibronectin-binding domain-containing protein [Pyrodictium delaneyi]
MIKRKRSMTSFDVAAVVRELSQLQGLRLNNIYQVGEVILLRLKGPGRDARVAIVPGERIHITSFDVSDKGMPPPFIMGIRKHIRGASLVEVKQRGFDRIVEMVFENSGRRYKLIAEILPRGVAVLVDENGRILQLDEQRVMKDRVLKRGTSYVPPPGSSFHPLELSVEHIASAVKNDGEAARVISRALGYPGEVVEEALARLGVEPSESTAALRGREEELVEAIRAIYMEAVRPGAYILYDERGSPLTVVPFEPRGLVERYKLKTVAKQSISEALDQYFVEELRRLEADAATREIEAERRKLLASLEKARQNLSELEDKLKALEKRAQLLAEHIAEAYEALECTRRLRETSGWEHILGNCPHVVDVQPSRGVLVLQLGDGLVEIDIRSDPSRLIVEIYRRVGEIRAKIERGRQAVKEIEQKLAELEKKTLMKAKKARAVVRRREWYERYHWLITSNKLLAIGGRDASQNESVVKRYLNDKRIFMHADIHGAPAVVLFAEGWKPPEKDLYEAALLTAAYSKAWKAGVGSIDVYWVWGSQVSKSPPPGEYLARGAFMVYGKRNYIRNVELKLAVGVGSEDEAPVVIVGPADLVRRRSLVYAVLVPGDEDPSKLAQRLKKLFVNKAAEEYRPIIEALRHDEIRERLPGRSRMVYIGRGEAVEPPRPLRVLRGEKGPEA